MFGERLSFGTLCILDTRPRSLDERERARLASLAETVVDLVRLRLGAINAIEAQEEARVREQFVAAQKTLLSTTLESIEHGIAVIGSDEQLDVFNDNFFELLDLPDALRRVGAPAREILSRIVDRNHAAVKGPPVTIADLPARLTTKAGRSIDLWCRSLPDGRFVIVATDVSERQRLEALKDEFVSTVSHELRTPLTSIRGALGLLEAGAGGPLGDKSQRLVTIARQNSDRLVRIINDLLDIGKIEAGKLTLHRKPIELGTLLEQAIESNTPFADHLGISLELRAAEDIVVEADPDRLQQVVTNLLSNAIKFSARGETITISLGRHANMARSSVMDRGAGIPEEFRARIFSKFAQADSTDQRRQEGTGLGLSIARSIVELHGGRIDFESEVGKGTTFHVDLPLPHSAPDTEADQSASSHSTTLIISKDETAARPLEAIMTRAGLQAEIVPTIEAAINRVAKRSLSAAPDAVIVNGAIFDGDTVSAVDSLRRHESFRNIPVLALGSTGPGSHRDTPEDKADCDPVRYLERLLRRSDRPAILHVEDDADLCRLVSTALGPVVDVTVAHDLATARRLVAERRFDLVILDVGLPDGSGLDLIPALDGLSSGSVPVVVFSGHELTGMVGRVTATLTKSRVPVETMVETVRRLIEAAAAQRMDRP